MRDHRVGARAACGFGANAHHSLRAVHWNHQLRRDGWLVLVCLMLVGAWIRLFFNLRHAGRTVWWIPVGAAAALAAIAVWIRPPDADGSTSGPPVSFAEVATIVEQRCASCHSGAAAPKGVRLETQEEITAQADAIERVVVLTRVMPLGNATGMTDAERELLGRWIASQR